MIGKVLISSFALATTVSALWNPSTASPTAWQYPTQDVVVEADPTITGNVLLFTFLKIQDAMYNLNGIPTTVSVVPQLALYTSPGVITTGPNGTRMIAALTFDDGPSLGNSELLYDRLDAHPDVTLFVVGSRVFDAPVLLLRAHKAGIAICAHTWSHPYFSTLDNKVILAEMEWTSSIFEDVIGMRPVCVRPPFGDLDARSESVLTAAGYLRIYMWSQDSTDSADGATTATTLSTMKTFLDQQVAGTLNGEQGGIFLQHDLLPVLDYALSKGLKIVPACVLMRTGIRYRVNGTVVNMTPSSANPVMASPSLMLKASAVAFPIKTSAMASPTANVKPVLMGSPTPKMKSAQPFAIVTPSTQSAFASSGASLTGSGVSIAVLLLAVLLV
ncbi:hypothetical protein SmJEL517_g05057 [Synchytrium microbalum]|uniref:NodB homology domain-containing protein n=1 Tax=Synchytrium microbalum TaxID=1806994 RepID=A0A507C0Y3_9FUNG|nr:uncharacterized protein SmJEL517_g05057 [Synchytrium microbalum]TPX31636.1 hypothetical protein SmJEL517_g05057 [Synchytrium microbalum]